MAVCSSVTRTCADRPYWYFAHIWLFPSNRWRVRYTLKSIPPFLYLAVNNNNTACSIWYKSYSQNKLTRANFCRGRWLLVSINHISFAVPCCNSEMIQTLPCNQPGDHHWKLPADSPKRAPVKGQTWSLRSNYHSRKQMQWYFVVGYNGGQPSQIVHPHFGRRLLTTKDISLWETKRSSNGY